jgi:DNA-directed RNA polymerase specialized sigma24 family protein
MNDVTRILSAIDGGDPTAAERLLPLVYDELRKLATRRLAREKPGQTLQPTALVHEAYLRLVGEGNRTGWNGRGHFFAAAAEAMRRILVDEALDQLAEEEPTVAELVKLRHFAGLTTEQAAEALGISLRTANRHWAYAKAWLFQRISE